MVIVSLNSSFENAHNENNVSHAGVNPDLSIITDVQIKLEFIAKSIQYIALLSQQSPTKSYRKVLNKAIVQFAEKCFSSGPWFFA